MSDLGNASDPSGADDAVVTPRVLSVDLELALAPSDMPDEQDLLHAHDAAVAYDPLPPDQHSRSHAHSRPHPPSSAPATPARAAHDELLLGLGRRFRGATLKLDFELRTNLTRQLFRRDFVYVSQQLHALEASRRVQGLDRQVLNAALISIERHGQFVKAMLKQATAEAAALIAEHALAATQIEFSPPMPLQATIVSPYARAYIDLLRMADDTLSQLERAWLLGALAPSTRSQLIADCRKLLQGYKEIVRQQRHVVGEAVREVNAARRAKRDEPATPADLARPPSTRRMSDDAGSTPPGVGSMPAPMSAATSTSMDAAPASLPTVGPARSSSPEQTSLHACIDEVAHADGGAVLDDANGLP